MGYQFDALGFAITFIIAFIHVAFSGKLIHSGRDHLDEFPQHIGDLAGEVVVESIALKPLPQLDPGCF